MSEFDYNHWLSGKGSCAVPECDCNGFYASQAIDAAIEPPEAPPDLSASVAALAETVAELEQTLDDWTHLVHARLETHSQRMSQSNAMLVKAVTELCDLVDWLAVGTVHMIGVDACSQINERTAALRALESPAAAPESVKSVFPRTYYVGVEKEPESAPEPDPLCQCGHPKSEHFNRKPLVCCKWDYCCCEEFVPQPSPATAHQKPPDAALKPVRPEPYVDKDGVKITPRRDNEIWQAVSYGHTLAYQKMPLTTTKEQPSGVIMQEPDEDAMLAIVQEQLRAIGYEIRSYRRDGAR